MVKPKNFIAHDSNSGFELLSWVHPANIRSIAESKPHILKLDASGGELKIICTTTNQVYMVVKLISDMDEME